MMPWITSVYLSVFFYIKPDDHDALDQFSVSISVFLHKTW